MNKKISLGAAIGVMALIAAATFIITFNYSMKVFNATVKNVSEKPLCRAFDFRRRVRLSFV